MEVIDELNDYKNIVVKYEKSIVDVLNKINEVGEVVKNVCKKIKEVCDRLNVFLNEIEGLDFVNMMWMNCIEN